MPNLVTFPIYVHLKNFAEFILQYLDFCERMKVNKQMCTHTAHTHTATAELGIGWESRSQGKFQNTEWHLSGT